MASITLQGITKTFGDVTAVRQMELAIGDGEFFVLLGPSGAGKTTTLRLIAGIEGPDHGRVLMNGDDVTNVVSAPHGVRQHRVSAALAAAAHRPGRG